MKGLKPDISVNVVGNVTNEDEETRSTKGHIIDLSGQHLNHINTTNNLFEMGSSSLLVEQGVRPGGLFSLGDRFIPSRMDENPRSGSIRFYHEENILLSRQAKRNQRRCRERNSSNSDESRSRSRSRGTSASSNDSNNRRTDSQDGRNSTHASRL